MVRGASPPPGPQHSNAWRAYGAEASAFDDRHVSLRRVHPDVVTLFGYVIPASALRSKFGTVPATIFMYTIYPTIVKAFMFAIVVMCEGCESGSFPRCLKVHMRVVHGAQRKGATKDVALDDWFSFWVATAVAQALFHTAALSMTLLAPPGMGCHASLGAFAMHESLLGRVAAVVRFGSAASVALYGIALFLLQPLNATFGHFSSAVMFLLVWMLLALPLHVALVYPLAPGERPRDVHGRRAWHLAVVVCLVQELLTAVCSVDRTRPVNGWLAALQVFSLLTRAAFVGALLWTGLGSVTLGTLVEYLFYIFPSWVVAGMAFSCLGPFNDAAAPRDACAPEAWALHGINMFWGVAAMCVLLAVVLRLTPIPLADAAEEAGSWPGSLDSQPSYVSVLGR